MYFLLNMVIFQPAMLVYHRVFPITDPWDWYIYATFYPHFVEGKYIVPYMDL